MQRRPEESVRRMSSDNLSRGSYSGWGGGGGGWGGIPKVWPPPQVGERGGFQDLGLCGSGFGCRVFKVLWVSPRFCFQVLRVC